MTSLRQRAIDAAWPEGSYGNWPHPHIVVDRLIAAGLIADLAALGIPADADKDDVRAAMLMWTHPTWRAGTFRSERFGYIVCEGEDVEGYAVGLTVTGPTRAAAVLALADKLAAQEATDA